MSIVILGGLITSTLVNLFIVPALYLLLAKKRDSSTLAASPSSNSGWGGGL